MLSNLVEIIFTAVKIKHLPLLVRIKYFYQGLKSTNHKAR